MSSPDTQQLGVRTATGLVIASMIGIGVYTSLGYQAIGLQTPFALLMLWTVGGVYALCGAFCYAELSSTFPRSGGEYHLLTKIYHPLLGFLAGWICITVGFSAPIALAAMAFGTYAQAFFGMGVPVAWGVFAILLMASAHCLRMRFGARVQDSLTGMKIFLILVFILVGCLAAPADNPPVLPTVEAFAEMGGSAFAISLVFVTYAYSGWNAAVYVAGETRTPARSLPAALLIGTILVTLLYLALNAVFLHVTPMVEIQALEDKEAVATLASTHIFGPQGGRWMNGIIAVGLLSTLGALVVTGSRIASTVGEDYPMLKTLAVRNRHGVPANAVRLQAAIALSLVATSSFQAVLTYVEFITLLSTFVTVGGIFIARRRFPEIRRPFRAPLYPILPLVHLGVAAWVLWHVMENRPAESLAGLATLLLGAVVYWQMKKETTRS